MQHLLTSGAAIAIIATFTAPSITIKNTIAA
jgi:hypothetical protein